MEILNKTHLDQLMHLHPGYESIQVAVETGLFRGQTAMVCAPEFREYHGIEINPGHIALCRRRLGEAGVNQVIYHEGDTRDLLPKVLARIREPALIMLDAHYSFVRKGKKFADEADMLHGPAGADFPLLAELRVISKRPWADMVLIDDTALFGKTMPVLRAPDATGKKGDTLPQWENMSHELVEQVLVRVIARQDWRGSTVYWRKSVE